MASNSSTATAAPGAAAGGQHHDETTYSCKWGIVTILNRQNYTTFKASCRSALIVAGAWNIVNGTETIPSVGTSTEAVKWNERRDRGLQIIYNSTSADIRSTLSKYMDSADPSGLWKHLQDTYDQSKDPGYISDVLYSFHTCKYNPPNDTINAFVRRLRDAQEKLIGTTNELTEEALFQQLVGHLPTTTE